MKKRSKNNKKASIMPEFSVKTVILILSFVILLITILLIAYTELIKDTTCEDSVVIRHSINTGFLPIDKIAPLTCTTKKLCLTQSGEGCGVFRAYTEDDFLFNRRIKTKDANEAREQIIDKIAEEMYNCQNLFTDNDGEPYEFEPYGWWEGHKKYCLVCSRIVLDEEARKDVGYITYGELYQKLSEKKTSDGRSYLEYFYPGWEDWRRVGDVYTNLKAQYPEKVPDKFEDWKIDMSNEHGITIVAQMAVDGYLKEISTTSAVLFGTALTATYVGAPLGIALIGSGVAGGVTFWYGSPDKRFEYSAPTIYSGDVDTLKSLECNAFETAP